MTDDDTIKRIVHLAPVTWEYYVFDAESSNPNYYGDGNLLDRVGAEGWELVSVSPSGGRFYFYFKRPL